MLSVSEGRWVEWWGTDSFKPWAISDGITIAHLLLHVLRARERRVKIKRETART